MAHATEQEVLSRIRRMRGHHVSIRRIAARLNDDGVAARGEKGWHPTTVARLLARAE